MRPSQNPPLLAENTRLFGNYMQHVHLTKMCYLFLGLRPRKVKGFFLWRHQNCGIIFPVKLELQKQFTRLFKWGFRVTCVCTANGDSELKNKKITYENV